jgi:hypothetical protein
MLAGGLGALPCGCIEVCGNTGIRRLEESIRPREMFAPRQWFGFAPDPRARELRRDQREDGIDATQEVIARYAAAHKFRDIARSPRFSTVNRGGVRAPGVRFDPAACSDRSFRPRDQSDRQGADVP